MKHVLLFLDGLAGDASAALDGRTPLEAADLPALDAMATHGRPAAVERDPWGRAITDEALLGLAIGIDPAVDPLGTAALAAAASGQTPAPDRVRMALDLVTIEDGILLHADAGGMTDAEGRAIAAVLGPVAASLHPDASVIPIAGHRLALELPVELTPDALGFVSPEALVGQPVADATPAGENAAAIGAFFEATAPTLAACELVDTRRDAGLPIPTHAWPWGPGRTDRRIDLGARYEGRRFAIVGRGESEAGLGRLADCDTRRPASVDPGAFVQAVRRALDEADAVIAWWRPEVRSDDPAGRVAAANAADRLIVGPLREALAGADEPDGRLAVIAGPARSTVDGRLLDQSLVAAFEGSGFHGPIELPFTEASADEAELRFRPGDDLLDYLIFGAGVRRPRHPRRSRDDAAVADTTAEGVADV